MVRFCNDIKVSWSVEDSKGTLLQSRDTGLPVVLQEKEDGSRLEILATHNYGLGHAPLELSLALADHLGIAPHQHTLLFLTLMSSVTPDRLTTAFRDADIPEYDESWEFTIENGYQGGNVEDPATAEEGQVQITLGVGTGVGLGVGGLAVDLSNIKLEPFKLSTSGSINVVSGGIMGIALVFATGTGNSSYSLSGSNYSGSTLRLTQAGSGNSNGRSGSRLVLSIGKFSGSPFFLPVLLFKERMAKKASNKEQYLGEKIVSVQSYFAPSEKTKGCRLTLPRCQVSSKPSSAPPINPIATGQATTASKPALPTTRRPTRKGPHSLCLTRRGVSRIILPTEDIKRPDSGQSPKSFIISKL